MQVLALRNAEADAASQRAIALLAPLPPGPELARAYRVEAQLRMLNRDCEAAVEWADKAIALASQFGEREILAEAVGTLGTATLFLDYDAGCAHLAHALELALADGLHGLAANTYSNLGSGSGEVWRLREARAHLKTAIAFAQRHEIDFYRHYAVAWLALCELHLGQWDDAHEHALDIVAQPTPPTTSRVMALAALGRLQARRGEPEAARTLDEALALALASGTLQRIAPVRARGPRPRSCAATSGHDRGSRGRAGAGRVAPPRLVRRRAGVLGASCRRLGSCPPPARNRTRWSCTATMRRPRRVGGARLPVRASSRAGRGRSDAARGALALFDALGARLRERPAAANAARRRRSHPARRPRNETDQSAPAHRTARWRCWSCCVPA